MPELRFLQRKPATAGGLNEMSVALDLPPQQGEIVRVRSRRYLVEAVQTPDIPTDQHLVRLSCLEDDAEGEPLEILWEKEIDARRMNEADWSKLAKGEFDPPRWFAAYYRTLRWNSVTSTDPKLFQAPYRAGIRIDAYQLEPLRKALLLPRVNLFIADDVGLGKTIEAGLIVRELLMRQRVRRIIVAAPPSVVLQWKEELDQRFGLTFVVLDRDYVRRMRQERGYGVNPWTTHSRFIVSHHLLRDEDYASPLRDWLGTVAPQSLLILDEAHNAAPASGARYAIDSQFTKSIRELAPRFEHRLFLSATPHNGHSNSFSALLEILDPQRFCRGVPVDNAKQLDAVMVRRLKDDLRRLEGGFPERKIVEVEILQPAGRQPGAAAAAVAGRIPRGARGAAEGGDEIRTERRGARDLQPPEAPALVHRSLRLHALRPPSGVRGAGGEDQARYPDTMDARYGAWAQLLVLFRLIHDGGGHRDRGAC